MAAQQPFPQRALRESVGGSVIPLPSQATTVPPIWNSLWQSGNVSSQQVPFTIPTFGAAGHKNVTFTTSLNLPAISLRAGQRATVMVSATLSSPPPTNVHIGLPQVVLAFANGAAGSGSLWTLTGPAKLTGASVTITVPLWAGAAVASTQAAILTLQAHIAAVPTT